MGTEISMTRTSTKSTDNFYLRSSAKFYVDQFKRRKVFLGLIKRMEAQGASSIQIRDAIEKQLGLMPKKSVPETYT